MSILIGSPEQHVLTDDQINELVESGEPAFLGIDLETTGLEAEDHHILSIALLFLDPNFEPIGDGIEIIVHQPESHLDCMDEWCWETHTKSGLVDKVRQSNIDLQQAEQLAVDFVKAQLPSVNLSNVRDNLPMFGNSIYLDRRFLEVHSKQLFSCFHYRQVDVSTVKEIVHHQYPELYHCIEKSCKHTALADILESAEEMRIYRDHLFRF